MTKPLEGVKIIDLTVYAAAPAAGRMLTDLGAEVIKVEPLQGEAMRTFGAVIFTPTDENENPTWELGNANKKSIPIDLKSEEGMVIMDKLLAGANAFITSNRTSALKKMGLDYDTMSKKHPHIVWGQINGFGDEGPEAAKAGFDTVAFWAKSGAMGDITEKGTPPIIAPIAFGDHNTACSLVAGVCAGLYKQKVTGKGEKFLISLYAQAIWAAGLLVQSTQWGIDEYQKTRTSVNPIVNSYKCRDGKWIFMTILEHERYWEAFCNVIERQDLIHDERYSTLKAIQKKENKEAIIKIVDEIFLTRDRDEWLERLTAADIAHDKVQSFADVATDPQAIANGYVYEYEFRNGKKMMAAAPPIKYGTELIPEHKHAPLLGENTIEIMTELNYTPEEIKDFIEKGVIKAL